VKITAARANARKRALEIEAGDRCFTVPYAKLRLVPTPEDPVVEIYPDPEIACEGFTYRLESGAEDTLHLDSVLEITLDPDYLQGLFLHRLTCEALDGLEESGLGKRQIARQLGTSTSQLYRLLDPTNTGKSVGQMLALLHLLDRRVDVQVRKKAVIS